jgi:His/Glu/Gln/Arg/opine family amino acid ABC transporter permease subunit
MINFVLVWLPQYLPLLLKGTLVTVELTCLSMFFALVLGILVALGRGSGIPWLRWILAVYLEIWRDVPLVVQLFIIYFTLPEIGIRMPAFWAGVLGLSLNLGAYLSEVFRAAIAAIAAGQRDAGKSLGMSIVSLSADYSAASISDRTSHNHGIRYFSLERLFSGVVYLGKRAIAQWNDHNRRDVRQHARIYSCRSNLLCDEFRRLAASEMARAAIDSGVSEASDEGGSARRGVETEYSLLGPGESGSWHLIQDEDARG